METKCHNCGNEKFVEQNVEEVFNIDGKIYLLKNIPAMVCTRCDEKYFLPATQKTVLDIIYNNRNVVSKIEAEVMEYI
jgi:HTH-type transcriptional regulator / antitoxin MqsA